MQCRLSMLRLPENIPRTPYPYPYPVLCFTYKVSREANKHRASV